MLVVQMVLLVVQVEVLGQVELVEMLIISLLVKVMTGEMGQVTTVAVVVAAHLLLA
jgi:hypothetical protein